MRLLIVIAVAALTAIVMTIVLETIDAPWTRYSAIRSGAVGAVSAVAAMSVSRNLRKKD